MTDLQLARQRALREEILRSNQVLRDWAAGLRLRSARAREVARARRGAGPGTPAVERQLGPLPPLGQVEVSDLFVILVDQHGFEVMDAVRALATGLAVAGYPLDHDSVSAADALDILHRAVNPHD